MEERTKATIVVTILMFLVIAAINIVVGIARGMWDFVKTIIGKE